MKLYQYDYYFLTYICVQFNDILSDYNEVKSLHKFSVAKITKLVTMFVSQESTPEETT